jgi:hypothetical protein
MTTLGIDDPEQTDDFIDEMDIRGGVHLGKSVIEIDQGFRVRIKYPTVSGL